MVLLALLLQPVIAGNILSDQVLYINEYGLPSGGRGTYKITNETQVIFDADIEQDIAKQAIDNINKHLTDIQLSYSFSKKDYGHAKEFISVSGDKRFKPNRLFVHLGNGFNNEFFANLRLFKNSNAPTGFIHLKKDDWLSITDKQIKIVILEHELRHLLLWGHPSHGNNSDFTSHDNNEPLYRLYDVDNIRGFTNVTITNKQDNEIIGFIAKKKQRYNSVYTTDNQVKLIPGRYKVYRAERYICKPGRKFRYCLRIKAGKKFNFKKDKILQLP